MREPTTEANNPIEQEFLSVIREYERVIYKVCYLYTHPNAPLNDLYQDVVLNLWKAYPKFRKECKISTWIYRIALNTCISFYRKEKNVPEIISLTKDIDRTIEAHDPINEMLKQLYQMINQLGQLDKSIILLYLEDKSYEEIAEITGLTVTNIATKLKPDRADVIVPAAEIFLEVATYVKATGIIVPTIGLSDGIIDSLYTQNMNVPPVSHNSTSPS